MSFTNVFSDSKLITCIFSEWWGLHLLVWCVYGWGWQRIIFQCLQDLLCSSFLSEGGYLWGELHGGMSINFHMVLQSSAHQNGQEQFLPSGNPSHEHLTINVEHATLLYINYSSHILIYISNLHIIPVRTLSIYCFCYFVHCLFCVFLFIICVLSL